MVQRLGSLKYNTIQYMPMETKWFAIYLFYPGDLDLMLNQLVHPFINEFFNTEADGIYFFIRYWKDGNHIRLRMNTDPVRQEMLSFELKKRAGDFFRNYPDILVHSDPTSRSAYPGHKVVYASYEPEIKRYGNLQSMPWAETHFFSSSAFILDWISSRKAGASVLIQALSIHLILLRASRWHFPRLIQLCDSFMNGWLPRLYDPAKDPAAEKEIWIKQFESSFSRSKDQVLPAARLFWESLIDGTATDKTSRFLQVNTEVMTNYSSAGFQETKLTEIACSLMHMNNNRLGISNYEEAYGAYCLRQVLDFISNP